MATAARGGVALVQKLSVELLDGLDALAAEMTGAIVRAEPAYQAASAEIVDDLRQSCHDNCGAILIVLARGTPPKHADYAAPHATGIRRSEQGVPLEAVLHAFRLGGRVIWDAMARVLRSQQVESLDPLLDAAAGVWEVVDLFSTQVVESYRRQALASAQFGEQRRQAAIDALLDGRGGDAAIAQEARDALELPAGGPFGVLVARAGAGGIRWQRAAAANLAARGIATAWRSRAEGPVALLALGRRSTRDVATLLSDVCPGVIQAAALGPVARDLAGVGEAFRLAEAVLRALPRGSDRVATLEGEIVPVLLQQNPWLSELVSEAILGELLHIPAGERRLLLGTLQAWIDADGSPGRAAESLFCHRNTVLNRMRRLETLTGRAVERPRDLVELSLALAQVRLAASVSADGRPALPSVG